MPRRLLPPNVSRFKDRHGHERVRYRKTGQPTYYFKNKFGTEGFREELRACIDGAPPPPSVTRDKVKAGTVTDLIARYYQSQTFLKGGPATQMKNRGLLEGFREMCGGDRVIDIEFEHLDAILARRAQAYPHAARNLRKQLRRLFDYAVKCRMRPDNPVEQTERVTAATRGHHSWTEDEIAAFQARHPLGTMARLAMEIMLWTGNRRGDAAILPVGAIKNGALHIIQEKGKKPLVLTIAKPLQEAIDAMPSNPGPTFLLTSFGKPFSKPGFGNKMRQWCDEANLPHCSAHGLRKAIARRMAELGQSNQMIKSVTGHSNDSEVALYTRGVEQASLAKASLDALSDWELANRKKRVAKNDTKGAE